jgi:RHS repeat-associated protein
LQCGENKKQLYLLLMPTVNQISSTLPGMGYLPGQPWRAMGAGGQSYARLLGAKRYELADHLGNVRAVVGDRRLPGPGGQPQPDVQQLAAYYPFGMLMPGKVYNADSYRYGFNGMEKENAVNEDGYDFGARLYNSWNGRWMSMDPLAGKYPFVSTYAYVANSPIMFIDPDGERIRGVKLNTVTGQYEFSKSAIKRGTDVYIYARMKTETGKKQITMLVEHKKSFKISVTSDIILMDHRIDEEGIQRYATLDGLCMPQKWIVLTTNTSSTESMIREGSPDDILNVNYITMSGNVRKLKILRSQLEGVYGNDETEYAKDYTRAYKDSGFAEWISNPNNQPGSEIEDLHNTGAHEEVHLLQNWNLSTYEAEYPAFKAGREAGEEYKATYSPNDTKGQPGSSTEIKLD